jgi:hypothetical protein
MTVTRGQLMTGSSVTVMTLVILALVALRYERPRPPSSDVDPWPALRAALTNHHFEPRIAGLSPPSQSRIVASPALQKALAGSERALQQKRSVEHLRAAAAGQPRRLVR